MPESASVPPVEYLRITLNIHKERFTEVMNALGALSIFEDSDAVDVEPAPAEVTSPSITIEQEVAGPESEQEIDPEEERSPYNPGMVEWVAGPDDPEILVPVITPALLRTFGERKYRTGQNGRAARLGRMMIFNAPEEVRPYLLLGAPNILGHAKGVGLRAEKATELLGLLQSREIVILQVRSRTITVLADYCEELFRSEGSEDTV